MPVVHFPTSAAWWLEEIVCDPEFESLWWDSPLMDAIRRVPPWEPFFHVDLNIWELRVLWERVERVAIERGDRVMDMRERSEKWEIEPERLFPEYAELEDQWWEAQDVHDLLIELMLANPLPKLPTLDEVQPSH